MMETIYDRLGDLLKETLDAGSVKFVRVEIPEAEDRGKDKNQAQEKDAGVRKEKFEDPAEWPPG